MFSLRHVRLRTSDTVTHCTLVTARVLKVTFVSPRPPICAQTTPLRYTTRHGTKTPGPEVGVKPNLAWQPERAVTAGTRADEPRPPRATQQPRKRFQQLAHTWQTTYRPIHDARGSPKWSRRRQQHAAAGHGHRRVKYAFWFLRFKALDTYARNCTQQLARSYLATYRWTRDARASAHKP